MGLTQYHTATTLDGFTADLDSSLHGRRQVDPVNHADEVAEGRKCLVYDGKGSP